MSEKAQYTQKDVLSEAPKAIRTGFREVINFVRASPLQQLGVGATLVFGCLAYNSLEVILLGTPYLTPALVGLSLGYLGAAGINEFIAIDKYQEFRKVRSALTRRGWDTRIIEPKSHSWCQRNAARMAAIDCGYKQPIDQYYKKLGYEWYEYSLKP